MVEEPPTQNEIVFLVQVRSQNLEYLLSQSFREGNFRLQSVESFKDIHEQKPDDRIIAFVIGSDVQDPIQSAQHLHAQNKNATIILLAEPQKIEALKEAVKFSPFIGTDVVCLDESKEEQLEEELDEIFKNSHQAAKYRDVIAETNSKIPLEASTQKSAFSQKFINKLMDLAPIGIAIVNERHKVLGWNKEAASIFEKNEAEILGKQLSGLFAPEEANKLEDHFRRSFETQTTDSPEPLPLERKTKDSSTKFLSLTASPFTYSNGDKKALILAIKDVTERKQARKDLQQINETLEERVDERTASLLSYQEQLRSLASQLSKAEEQERQRLATEIHDNLGQMLAVNKMKLDLLQKNQLPEETATQIEEVKEGVDEALKYARNLMSDLKPPPSLDKEDVKATIEWLAGKMEKHSLKVIVEDDGQPKKATEEIRTTLLQCIREVLFNVIRHSGVNRASIDMSRTDNQVQVIVQDKGKGFNPEIDTLDVSEDEGFGLFNISERLDLLGGSVDIESEPGKGTRVTLTAPLKDGDDIGFTAGDEEDDNIVAEPEESGQTIKVMLVDDHQMVRIGLKRIVDAENDLKVVAEASDGKEAIELARKTSPDVIVMDVDMPNMDGIEATQQILSTMSDVRVIGLSLHNQQEVVESMRSAGATAYLSKGEAFETLCATIRSEAKMVK